jgi:hypothetical protein
VGMEMVGKRMVVGVGPEEGHNRLEKKGAPE